MKLQIKATHGQREAQWASVLLGYNTDPKYNIGMWGCLITSFGNYIGQTPIQVNNVLKANGGFTAGSGNFIWSKCTVLGLNQVYASPYYSNPVTAQGIAKMKSLLDEGRPLITHVDFDPKDPDDDQHWILVMGYEGDKFFAFDPWSDSEINLDVYGGTERAVYEFKAYDMILPKVSGDALTECLAQHTKLVDEGNAKSIKITELQDKLTEVEANLTSTDKARKEAEDKLVKSEAEVLKLTPFATKWNTVSTIFKVDSPEILETKWKEQEAQIAALQSSTTNPEVLKECRTNLALAKKQSVKIATKKVLLAELFNRFFK